MRRSDFLPSFPSAQFPLPRVPLARRRQDLPGSWRDPSAYMPGSSTPVGRKHQALTMSPYCLQSFDFLGSHESVIFRGSITRLTRSLSTLRRLDCSSTTQDSLPVGGQPLPEPLHCGLGLI